MNKWCVVLLKLTGFKKGMKQMSLQGCTNEGETLDLKPGARTFIFPSGFWATEPHSIDSRGEQLRYKSYECKQFIILRVY
jgi:hypothetical protein